MTAATHVITATVKVGAGVPLDIITAQVTLDDSWSPYIQAEMTCWLPGTAALDAIDPRKNPRITVTLTRVGDGATETRTLNLLVRERAVDHHAGRMVVRAASDEALLIDHARISSLADTHGTVVMPTVNGYNLSNFINAIVLGQLQAENLSRNPTPNATWVHHTALTPAGPNWSATTLGEFYYGTRTTTGAVAIYMPQGDPDYVTAGKTYTYQFEARPSVTLTLQARAHDPAPANTVLASGTSVSCPSTAWTKLSVTFTATSSGRVNASVLNSVGAIGDIIRVRRLTLIEGTAPLNWSTPTLTTVEADMRFTTDAAALNWEPGTAAWDLVEPLLQTANLRLICDGDRKWHLIAPSHHDPGLLQATAAENITRAEDTISREKEWFDAVVIEYKWVDTAGVPKQAWDAAGQPGTKALNLKYERPFPGAGAAAAILARSVGRGRVLDLETTARYLVNPSQAVAIELPSSPTQTGWLSSVSWRFPEGRMRIGTREATDTIPAAWSLLAVGHKWTDSPVGGSWTAETI